jgi:acetyl esterase
VSTDEGPPPQDLRKLEFRQIVQLLESQDAESPPGAVATTKEARRFPELDHVDVREVEIDGPHGAVRARVYKDSQRAIAGLVWVHGGAFIGGDLDMPEAHWVALALAAKGVVVLSLDYRKALRGVRYPIPSDDILAGWRWATDHAEELGIRVEDLHLGGASAGANLVAGVTKRLRDGAGRRPASLVLVYPIVHAELPPLSAEIQEKVAGQRPAASLPAEAVREFNLQYAGSEGIFGDPYAFPANGPLADQPPVYILNAEADFLRASGEAYGDALRSAGVDVTVETESGTKHGHLNEPDEPSALASIDRLASWLHHQAARDTR